MEQMTALKTDRAGLLLGRAPMPASGLVRHVCATQEHTPVVVWRDLGAAGNACHLGQQVSQEAALAER